MKNDLSKIQKFVGTINREQLRYVDSFVGEDMTLFMPVGGACYFALIPEHMHPSYMFVLPFDDRTSLMLDGQVITTGHGRLFALSPEIPHHELPSDYPPRYIAIFINKGYFEKQLREYPVREDVIFRGGIYDPGVTLLPLLRKLGLRGIEWVNSYLFKHTSKNFEPEIFLIAKTICSSLDYPNLIIQSLHET